MEGGRMREIRIPIGYQKYLIWNRNLEFGEETSNEDLWNRGYGFGLKIILGIKFLIASKEK